MTPQYLAIVQLSQQYTLFIDFPLQLLFLILSLEELSLTGSFSRSAQKNDDIGCPFRLPAFYRIFSIAFFTTNTNTPAYIYLSLISKDFTISNYAKLKLNYIYFELLSTKGNLLYTLVCTNLGMHSINSSKDNFKTKLLEQITYINHMH